MDNQRPVGRPTVYGPRQTTSLNLERDLLKEVKLSGYTLSEVFLHGWETLIPVNMSAMEYRDKQLKRKEDRLTVDINELEENREMVRRERKSLREYEVSKNESINERNEAMEEHWPDFIRKLGRTGGVEEKKPKWKEYDTDKSEWWAKKGIEVSYGELTRMWDLMNELCIGRPIGDSEEEDPEKSHGLAPSQKGPPPK